MLLLRRLVACIPSVLGVSNAKPRGAPTNGYRLPTVYQVDNSRRGSTHVRAAAPLPFGRHPQAAWVDIDFARDVMLERRLGSGAHGTVFAAWWVGRPVAVKVVALLEADGGGVCAHAVESIRQEVQVGGPARLASRI